MDKFVENIVDSVLGASAKPDDGLSRPNYQRRKTQSRLIVSEITPPSDASGDAAPTAADPCPAIRRASLAAMVPCQAAEPPAQPARQGCRCQSSGATFQQVDDAPRSLGDVLSIRLRGGESIVSISVLCADTGRLVASDELLDRHHIGPEAITYATVGQRELLIAFAADAATATALLGELRTLWQGCANCGQGALSPAPSSKLLNHLGIARRGALGIVEGRNAAEVTAALGVYLKSAAKTDVRLIERAACLHGSLDAVRSGVELLNSIMATIRR
ncbi:hypothetical protein JHU04_001213 [Brenneria sp. 4F2]|nr:hypothetical protein [Brenneria bubanii]